MGSHKPSSFPTSTSAMAPQTDDKLRDGDTDQGRESRDNMADQEEKPTDKQQSASRADMKDSATNVIDVPTASRGDDPDHSSPEDLKGSFTVVTSSNLDSVDSDETRPESVGIEKCLTLTVCRSPLSRDNPAKEMKDKVEEIAGGSEFTKEVVTVKNEETFLEKDTGIHSVPNESIPALSEHSDSMQSVKLKSHDKRVRSKNAAGILYQPVLEIMDETTGGDEAVTRINGVVGSHGQMPSNFTEPVDSPAERGREHKQSMVGTLKNRGALSVDGPMKRNRPGRGRAVQSARTTPMNREDNRLTFINTAEWIPNNTEHIGNIPSSNRITSKKEGCCGDQKTYSQRHNRISLSLDGSVTQISFESKKRTASVFEMRYTKRELRTALPRRCFFSCHDKAMKDAGLETDDPVAKKKAERLKARLERIANEFCNLPSSRETVGKETKEISVEMNSGINIEIDELTNGIDHGEVETAVGDLALDHDLHITDVMDATSKHDPTKLSVKPSKKKRPESARSDHVDCRPLIQYLEYVRDNREEYLHHSVHTSSLSLKSKPISRLISMGKAFELRHMGGIPRNNDDVIVMAAKALRPRASDPSKYARTGRDKLLSNSSSLHAQDTIRTGRPTSEDKRKQERNSAAHSKEDEHAKTEMERRKLRAEEWTRTVSTNTLTKAKIQSLHELGTDDRELVKWWEALRDCRYLRDT